jgi:protein tyrosine phosphatase
MAPMPDFCGQFWRMVVEHDVRTIVMVTGLVEKGVSKCPPYWPQATGSTVTHNGIVIKCGKKKNYGNFMKTSLTVTKQQDSANGTTRPTATPITVSHWWYTAWLVAHVPTMLRFCRVTACHGSAV